jgi:serine phosphatase RsbU (regulator of sigma subunit)
MTKTLLFFLFLGSLNFLSAQLNERQKSLLKELNATKKDSIRIYILSEIAYEYEASSLEKANEYYDKAIALAKKSKSSYWLGKNYGYKALIYQFNRDYDSAVFFLNKAIKIAESLNDREQQSKQLCNLGKTYFENDKIPLSIEAYKKALTLSKNINQQLVMSSSYRGIGVCYDKLGNYNYSLKYHNLALAIDLPMNYAQGIGMDYSNIANAYMDLKNLKKASEYYTKAIDKFKELGIEGEELAITYNNQASIKFQTDQFQEALSLFFKAKDQFKLSKETGSIPFINKNIASCYLRLNQIDKAKIYIDSALMNFTMASNPRLVLESRLILAEILMKENRNAEAAKMLFDMIGERDSLAQSYQIEKLNELEVKFQSKEKDMKIKEAEAEKKEKDAALSLQKSINERRKIFVFGLSIVGLLLLFLFLNLRKTNQKTQKANKEIARQKLIIEEKSEEITASIRYAERIQNAILPSHQILKDFFKDYFVLYLPKDIVAGDFYWTERKDNFIMFAAADCTGHGVPGAMMSVVCFNALNQAVREFSLVNPAEILNKTRELVLNTLSKNDQNVMDGMDISLSVIDLERNILHFSGANNSLYVFKNASSELLKLKGNRYPIGFSHEMLPFTSETFHLDIGDRIFSTTDGFPDQFGGEQGKKYKTKNFEELLLSIQDLELSQQQNRLLTEFQQWKRDYDQTDDVCVFSIEL